MRRTAVWELYKTQPSFILGFHGCDEEVGRAVIAGGTHLVASSNNYDWLGNGIYFWEGSPQRALEWAQTVQKRRPHFIKKPFVVGAVIDLGNCFNMTDTASIAELRSAYDMFKLAMEEQGLPLPQNKGGTIDRPLRYLDRAVIEFMHQMRVGAQAIKGQALREYDSVRCPFLEGDDLYPGAGIRSLVHVQVTVRTLSCIKGYFLPIRTAG